MIVRNRRFCVSFDLGSRHSKCVSKTQGFEYFQKSHAHKRVQHPRIKWKIERGGFYVPPKPPELLLLLLVPKRPPPEVPEVAPKPVLVD